MDTLLKFFVNKLTLLPLLLLISFQNSAAGVSPYLPIQSNPVIELEIERLATIAKMPMLKKPYHVASVLTYLEKVKTSHPQLYFRVNGYLDRYKKSSGRTHIKVEVNAADSNEKSLPNQRGRTTDSIGQAQLYGFTMLGSNVILNYGGTMYDGGGYIPNNTFISMGGEYLQVDLGYKEHWLGPFQESSMLLSTQAEPFLNITFSNSKPFESLWNLKYDVAIGLLDTHQGIKFGDTRSSGEPGFLTTQLSVQPLDWLTIGANRTMMFAGGERSVDLQDIWDAFWDPVSNDNCGGGSSLTDCDDEFGDQKASVTFKADFNLFNQPLSLYYEYAGEDTQDNSNFSLGNVAHNFGVFLPYLTPDSSIYVEVGTAKDAWYVHHIYQEGYSNHGTKMGHWWGMEKDFNDGVGADFATIRYNLDITPELHMELQYRTVNNDDSTPTQPAKSDYDRSHELEVSFNKVYQDAFIGLNLYGGQDTYGESFYRIGISYTW